MIAIIAHHFSVHGKFDFPLDIITTNKLWAQFILMGGSLGNSIFVLISGYFLVQSDDLKLRKIFNIWARVIFYSLTIFAIFTLSGIEPIKFKDTVKAFMPLTYRRWWFASCWFSMYLIHPFLNILIKNLDRKNYIKMLLITGVLFSIIPSLKGANFISSLGQFIYLYFVAGYIKLHADNFGNAKFIWLGILGIALTFASVIILDFIGLKFAKFAKGAAHFYQMLSPNMLFTTVCLLIGFKNLHINTKFTSSINLIAAATFGVYLIHDSSFVGKFLWIDFFKNASYQDSPYLIIYSIGVILLVYVVCTMIEIVSSKIFKILSKGYLN